MTFCPMDTSDSGDFPTQTWGVLLRYKGLELYYRYEGDGEMNMTVDRYGDLNVAQVQGNAIIVSLPDLTYSGN